MRHEIKWSMLLSLRVHICLLSSVEFLKHVCWNEAVWFLYLVSSSFSVSLIFFLPHSRKCRKSFKLREEMRNKMTQMLARCADISTCNLVCMSKILVTQMMSLQD